MRRVEYKLERELGLELVNPFYDTERHDIEAVDSGQMSPFGEGLDFVNLVERDLAAIDSSDGVLALVMRDVPGVGTHMEIMHAVMAGKPVYIVSPDFSTHPWLRWAAHKSGGFVVLSFADFTARIRPRLA